MYAKSAGVILKGHKESNPCLNTESAHITADAALSLLKRTDLSADVLLDLSKNSLLMKQRKVKFAVVQHPKVLRHVAIPILRSLFTFDLMRVALTPGIHADIKVAAEETLILRLEKLSLGEKLALARRASSRVVSALLHDHEIQVMERALNNSRLTETAVLKEVMKRNASESLVNAVAAHSRWGVRKEIIAALESRREIDREET